MIHCSQSGGELPRDGALGHQECLFGRAHRSAGLDSGKDGGPAVLWAQRLHSGQHGPPNGSGPDEVTGPYYIHIVIMHILYNVHFIAFYDVIINSVFIKSKSFIFISGW